MDHVRYVLPENPRWIIRPGKTEWIIDEDTFTATPGMAIYHAPNTPHRMVNRGSEPLRTVWFWWAPDGRANVLGTEVKFLEPLPQQITSY